MYPLKVRRHSAYPWHLQRALTYSGTGKSQRHSATIDMLIDDVLLEIFDFCRRMIHDNYPFWPPLHPVSNWCILVHVCRRWRQIIFESPHRLNLRILCTYRTPVRTNLGIWPAFPIVLELCSQGLLEPQDEHNVITTLQHKDRVCSVRLYTTGSQLAKAVTFLQEPLPMLTDLYMRPTGLTSDRPVLTAEFLGGSAPNLLEITLHSTSFPALPTLLLSTSHLVSLNLFRILPSGYISPERMVTCLGALPKLKTFTMRFRQFAPWFESSRPDKIHPFPATRPVLPALTDFDFMGQFEYLEDLVAQIDSSPRLERVSLIYRSPLLDLQATQLSEFVDRSIGPEFTPSRHALVHFHSGVTLTLSRKYANYPNCNRRSIATTILCSPSVWKPFDVARVLSQFSAAFSTVFHLDLELYHEPEDFLDDDYQSEDALDVDWLGLLRQFPAMQMLHVSMELAAPVFIQLKDITAEYFAELFPSLDLICLQAKPAPSLEKIVSIHRFSDYPVTVVRTTNEFTERLESRYSIVSR